MKPARDAGRRQRCATQWGGETIWLRFRRKAARGRALPQPAPARASGGQPDTKETEALASALNHSAERAQTLWFSFLTFMLYLAIATGTTTHRMLFLEEPLNLPVLNIKLPLLGFYVLTPIIFVVFHFYMLLNLVLLARTAKSFEDALARAFPEDGEAREAFRMRIENTLFVQLLVGGRLEREGINANLLSWMALITLALAPVVLLLYLQIKFLPYHSEWITWLHRGLLALDLALVWTLWPGYRSGWGVMSWPKRSWRLVAPGFLSAAALAYAVGGATFPDEHMYLAWLHRIAPINTLDLHGEDLIDDAKLVNITKKNKSETGGSRWEPILPLNNRDLTEANLSDTDIRQVDFSDTIFSRANLDRAWARNAHFDKAQLQRASLKGAQLQGASLNKAQLQSASLDSAQLQDASLDDAQLQGASLLCDRYVEGKGYDCPQLQNAKLNGAQLGPALLVLAQLQGASLNGSSLQGAWLDGAQLQGASLEKTQLQGASLKGASLQGASLNGASLQGASLDGAQLQGASLEKTQLQGASLDKAQLQGASLQYAQLQGASLNGASLQGASLLLARLQGASLEDVCAWRADARFAIATVIRVQTPETHAKESPDKNRYCDWTAASFDGLKKLITEQVPEGGRRATMDRIEKTLDPNKPLDEEEEMATGWAEATRASSAPEVYEKNLAAQWSKTGCAAEGAPYVIRALLQRLDGYERSPLDKGSPEVPKLAAAFLDTNNCLGARGLSEGEVAKLKEITTPAAPPTPKP